MLDICLRVQWGEQLVVNRYNLCNQLLDFTAEGGDVVIELKWLSGILVICVPDLPA